MARVQTIGGVLVRLIVWIAGISAVLALLGAGYAHFGGHDLRGGVASALFIGGAVVFIGSAATGGGARGQLHSAVRNPRHQVRPEMPFAWVLVGVRVIGVGVLVVIA